MKFAEEKLEQAVIQIQNLYPVLMGGVLENLSGRVV